MKKNEVVHDRYFMEYGESTTSLLQALKLMGVRLALDDFGTGDSSLSYLREFPIDVLKIDQSFVCQMTANSDDAAIVVAAIGIGKNLKLRVIAEGVETPEQLAFLQGQQCAEAQGNFFSRLSLCPLYQVLYAVPSNGEVLSELECTSTIPVVD